LAPGGETLVDESVEIPELTPLTEVVLEFSVVGNVLSGSVWEVGQPKPAEPQFTYTDDLNSFATGVSGIGFDDDVEDTTAVYRYVASQDTPFVDASGGDFDSDGDVDGADFLTWQRGLGLTGQPNGSTGDADGDGDVDQADLGVWNTNFNGTAEVGAIGAVPEPAALALGALGLLGMAAVRGRRR
jgi:hypothetical protein